MSVAGFRLGALGITLATVLLFTPVLTLDHVGHDTYPILLSSRIVGWGDFWATFAEEWMGGRYPRGHLYRPVANLSFALDHALWGETARGYHATDLLVFGLSVLGVAGLARRLLGARWGALIAVAVFALHPLQMEVVPASSRRSDMLAVAFCVMALWIWPGPGARRPRTQRLLAAVGALLAIASNEKGAVGVLLLLGLEFLRSGEAGETRTAGTSRASLRLRIGGTLRRVAPAFVLVALYLAGRTAVLGGLGGHPASDALGLLHRIPEVAFRHARLVVVPQPLGLARPFASVVLAATACAAAAVLLVGLRARDPAIAFSTWWFALATCVIAPSGEMRAWYGLAVLPPFAIFCGSAFELARARVQRRGWRRAAPWIVATLLLVVIPLRDSPALASYSEWWELSERQRAFCRRFERTVDSTPLGGVATLWGMPVLQPKRGRVGVQEAKGISRYGLRAYAELRLPGRPVRIVNPARDTLLPVPGTITLAVGSSP